MHGRFRHQLLSCSGANNIPETFAFEETYYGQLFRLVKG